MRAAGRLPLCFGLLILGAGCTPAARGGAAGLGPAAAALSAEDRLSCAVEEAADLGYGVQMVEEGVWWGERHGPPLQPEVHRPYPVTRGPTMAMEAPRPVSNVGPYQRSARWLFVDGRGQLRVLARGTESRVPESIRDEMSGRQGRTPSELFRPSPHSGVFRECVERKRAAAES
jgi:hypothetical protein